MIAAETGKDSVGPLKCVDEPRRRQRVWAEPAAQIEKSCHNAQNDNSNAPQSYAARCLCSGALVVFPPTRSSHSATVRSNATAKPTYSWIPISTSGRPITYTLVPSTCNIRSPSRLAVLVAPASCRLFLWTQSAAADAGAAELGLVSAGRRRHSACPDGGRERSFARFCFSRGLCGRETQRGISLRSPTVLAPT